MATASPFPVEPPAASPSAVHAKLNKVPGTIGSAIFLGALAIGFVYAAYHLISDLSAVHSPSIFPFVLLGVALLVALGFEFVNGFHDTANAVATVIYTHSLDPHIAVAWSGMWNFIGVVLSTGAVAFGIISLLPVELILQVGSGAGFAMVFALLTAAIIWNLGTWYFGLPNSSSHTLIGSIIGVGIANQLMQARTATSGVDWGQALNVGKSLLFSPIVGFILAASLLSLSKFFIRDKRLYTAPEGDAPPPLVDSRSAGPYLHRRQLCAWLQRRPEGHGADHADPHRHRADGVRSEPCHHAGSSRRSSWPSRSRRPMCSTST